MIKAERTFQDLAENIPQLVWTVDPQGKALYLNQRFLQYTGYDSVESVRSSWKEILHPEEAETVIERWEQSLATGEPFLIEYRLRGKDGAFRWFLARAVPLREEDGRIELWIGSCTDIHEQKLGEEVLRRSEKLATAGRLAASVAHEINNPLTSVTNLLYLLAHNPSLDRAAREYINSAQEELGRVAEITTQMLRFHKQSTAAIPTRISETLDSILALYRGRIISAGIQLTRDYDTTAPLVCFAGDIRQAFANLIGNAIDATPSGGRLRVRLRHSRNWTTRLQLGIRVTIADTGRGIDAEGRKHLFEAFYTTKGITGTGLGLWITRDLIEKHSGTISLRSSTCPHTTGTVFSIFLPFEAHPNTL